MRSSESGFSRKSYAPSLVALTAVSMVPWPEMMTTSGRFSRSERMNVGEHVEAVAIGEPDVEENDVVGRVLNEHESLSSSGGSGHAVSLFA